MCALLMASFWVYIEHPEWLEGSNAEDERVEKILEANPELTLEDLEADAQSGDLSFWLRTNPDAVPQTSDRQSQPNNKQDDPLEVFQKKQREEAKKKQNNSESNNPLLNFSALDNLTGDRNAREGQNPQLDLNLETLSLSTPLDRMLRGEVGSDRLTPLEAEILSLQQSPTPTDNSVQPQGNDTPLPFENTTGQGNPNPNIPLNPTANDPDNLTPNAANRLDNSSLGLPTQQRTTLPTPIEGTPRRGVEVNGVNGVVPTTPVIPPQTGRRAVVSPRRVAPPSATTPNNAVSPLNDPYSQAQPARANQPVQQAPRPVNPNNRIGGGEINTFSNPYGTGQ